MKAAIKTAEGWEQSDFPTDPTEQMRWLHAHDTADAVVVWGDGTRYCAQDATVQAYREQGKKAGSFLDLLPIVCRGIKTDMTTLPDYCNASGRDAWCGMKESCGGNGMCR